MNERQGREGARYQATADLRLRREWRQTQEAKSLQESLYLVKG